MNWNVLITAALFIVVGTAHAADAPVVTLDGLKGIFEKAQAAIETDCAKQKADALEDYGKTLDATLAQLKQQGKLNDYLVVGKEKKRFVAEKAIPVAEARSGEHITLAAKNYEDAVAKADADKNKKTVDLIGKYTSRMDLLIKDLMKADKIADAKLVQDEKQRVESILSVIQAETPVVKAERVPDGPPPVPVVPMANKSTEEDKPSGASPQLATNRVAPNNFPPKPPATLKAGGVPADILAQIKAKAEMEAPTNNARQRDIVNQQSEAYIQLQALKKKHIVPDDIFALILQGAETEASPNHYVRQRDIVNGQSEAYIQLQALKKKHTVPDDVFALILQGAEAEASPNNYGRQRDIINQQSEAYIQLQALKKKHIVPDDIFAIILQKAEAEAAPNHYVRQRDIVNQQSEAYVQLQALKKKHTVPDDVFAVILQRAEAEATPNNYGRQRDIVRGQCEAYMKKNAAK